MRMTLLALGGATVATVALTAIPADARQVHTRVCTRYVNGVCTDTHKVRFKVGHVFGPTYTYTPVAQLPPAVVTQYSLGPDYRYVYSGGYIYVVDPATYAVTRVIDTITQ